MPKAELRCDAKGVIIPKTTKLKQGDEPTKIEVTYDSHVTIDGYEQAIADTALGKTKLHATTNASGVGNVDAKGYIHTGKMLFLVSRLDTKKHTIQIEKEGKVNSGKHEFS